MKICLMLPYYYPEVISTNITFVKDNSNLNKDIDYKINMVSYNH